MIKKYSELTQHQKESGTQLVFNELQELIQLGFIETNRTTQGNLREDAELSAMEALYRLDADEVVEALLV